MYVSKKSSYLAPDARFISYNKSSAFTLVEIAVVIIIIGLVLGGVLVGKDLIYGAQIRKQITQLQNLESVITTFKIKYNCLPGDCEYATTIFGTSNGLGDTLTNGNGDGIIRGGASGSDCLAASFQAEPTQFWWQINLSGIGSYVLTYNKWKDVVFPKVAWDDNTYIGINCLRSSSFPTIVPTYLVDGSTIMLGMNPFDPSDNTTNNNGYSSGLYGKKDYNIAGRLTTYMPSPYGLPVDVVRQIDMKTDDGIPNDGLFGVVSYDTAGCLTSASTYANATITCSLVAGKNLR